VGHDKRRSAGCRDTFGSGSSRATPTTAVSDIMSVGFVDLDLHRIEAGTPLDNIASRRVLERNGFVRFGVRPGISNTAGTWQDHAMYQAVNPNRG
jgi:[ribosomal protein S5]-alanine N-acetyltransferase